MTHTPETGTSFLVRVFGTGFWYVCHWHKSRTALHRRTEANVSDHQRVGLERAGALRTYQ